MIWVLFPLKCRHYEGGVLKGVYAIRLFYDSGAGVWKRSQNCLYDHTRYLESILTRAGMTAGNPDTSEYTGDGLCIVPASKVWSREDLAKSGSEIIYVSTVRIF